MVAFTDPEVLVAVVLTISFLAPLFFLVRLRNAERRRREPWRAVLGAFLWGAAGAAPLAFLLNTFLGASGKFPATVAGLPYLAIVLAPLVEETLKALGIAFIHDKDPERHDGYIYGAAAGLGFAFTENLYYAGVVYVLGGVEAAIATAIFRAIATVSLHAATSALVGYALWRLKYGSNPFPMLLYLPVAVALHAAYNALASLALGGAALAAALLAVLVYRRILRQVRLDGSGR